MASPINNIPASIIEETLIKLESNSENPANITIDNSIDDSILETVETEGFRGINEDNLNVYLKFWE